MAKQNNIRKKVAILLPTFNEKTNVIAFIDEVLDQEKNVPGWKFEILVVDDERSSDGTFEEVQKLAHNNPKVHVIKVSPGLGTALIEGHRYSIKHFKPQALAQLDADGQVAPEVLPRLLSVLDEGYNFAIGSRFIKGGQNLLSPTRKFFTNASSLVSRLVMGPLNIKEWSNSARAFTPELFEKIDLKKVPWQEQSFIVQPAFLQAAVQAGAKYKEVPLIFKNREVGYSKMKIFNYSYDVIAYSIDTRTKKMGMNLPIFRWSRKAKTPIKFGTVGFAGTFLDFLIYKVLINALAFTPTMAKTVSTEIAIINNFAFNNFWTFKGRNVKTKLWQRFLIYNSVSLGGLLMAVGIVKLLDTIYGVGFVNVFGKRIAYNNFFFFATIPPVMVWNFTVNHFITWKHKE